VAGDGDVLACVDVGTTREAGDSDEEGETSWTARLVRLDGASGRVVWTAGLKENQAGESACDGLATTSDGHVVLGQHDVDGLAVFAGKDKPALDATPTKADLFARGLQPGTIVTADDGTIQELDVASGAVVWSYKVPMSVNIDSIASGGGLVAITGSYDEAFDGGAAGKLSATDDLAGFVLVVRAPTQAR
jgi:outer membrane protein assembly factor BamB